MGSSGLEVGERQGEVGEGMSDHVEQCIVASKGMGVVGCVISAGITLCIRS